MFRIFLIAKPTPIARALCKYLQFQSEVVFEYSEKSLKKLNQCRVVDAIVIEESGDPQFVIRALDSVSKQNIDVPIIIYSEQRDTKFVVEVMKKGADDYLSKTEGFDKLKAKNCVLHTDAFSASLPSNKR